jgi:hypothetical protein
MKVVLVGESWGQHEELRQHPLVWWSGRELARMIGEAKLGPELRVKYPTESDMIEHWRWLREDHNIAVTNVFNEHPQGDNTELFFDNIGEADLPPLRIKSRVLRLRPKYRYHVDRLWKELEEYRPNLVIALGNFACWALLGQAQISAIRGTPKITQRLGIKCLPTYHPAALRDWSLRPTIIADLIKAARESAYPEIHRIQRWITCEDPITKERVTLDEIEAWFNVPASSYSVDIETGYVLFTRAELKNMSSKMKRILAELISMVSFARNMNEAVVIPFMTRDDPELNYWKTPEEEIRAWRIVIHALASSETEKIFQNGIFDISHFLRNKIRVLNATDDTMILSHALFPERPKSLSYLASIFSDEIAWKTMRARGEDLKREG